jgi:hypothetical protein
MSPHPPQSIPRRSSGQDGAKPLWPRGRARKVKPAAEPSAASPVASKPTIGEYLSPQPIHLQAEAAPAKIDKSKLTISEVHRHSDKGHFMA